MASYLARRILLAVPILIGISLIVFLMLHSAGGDPAEVKLGARGDKASIAALRHEFGLDRPLAVQYLDFLGGAIHGDLGRSYRSNAPVANESSPRFPATIELALVALLIGGGLVCPQASWRRPGEVRFSTGRARSAPWPECRFRRSGWA